MSMTHPCTDHPCDHCYLCDVVGICCMTVAAGRRVAAEAQSPAPPDVLHDAIVQDAKTAPSLPELIRAEGVRPRLAGLLLPNRVAEPIPDDSRKEAILLAPRTTR
jgi:hypothetical protein